MVHHPFRISQIFRSKWKVIQLLNGLFDLDIRANEQTAEFRLQLRNDLQAQDNMYIVSPFRINLWGAFALFRPFHIAVFALLGSCYLQDCLGCIYCLLGRGKNARGIPSVELLQMRCGDYAPINLQFNKSSKNTPQHVLTTCAQRNLLLQVSNKQFRPITHLYCSKMVPHYKARLQRM